MAVRLKPRGTVIRNPPDWFARYLMGALFSNGPCVGNRTIFLLYNNASDGSVLRVYGVNLQVGANTAVYFKTSQGVAGVLQTGEGAPAPIDPRTPMQWGQIYLAATATGLGTVTGGITMISGPSLDFNFGYPIGIVPPGWNFIVESQATNVLVLCGLRWLSLYE